jgi:uncharacterized Fe-S cluster-containing radical SAM superfamily enzyme
MPPPGRTGAEQKETDMNHGNHIIKVGIKQDGQTIAEPTPRERQAQQLANSMSAQVIENLRQHFTRRKITSIIFSTITGGTSR